MVSPHSLPDLEPAAVRTGAEDAPEQFLWQGRLHRVLTVLEHREGSRVEEWRVRAAAGQRASVEVFDLSFDWSAGCWRVRPAEPATGVSA
jgi:hypothetical protein